MEFVNEANWNAPRSCVGFELLSLLECDLRVCLKHLVDVAPAFGFLFFRHVLQRAEPAKDSTVGVHACKGLLEPLGSLRWLLKHRIKRCFGFGCRCARQCRLLLFFEQCRVAAKLDGTLARFFGCGIRDGCGSLAGEFGGVCC